MKKIVVTGGNGGLGQAVIADLLEHDYEVINVDVTYSRDRKTQYRTPYRIADLTDYGQTFANLKGADGVVHLAGHPSPDHDHFTGAQRFHNNTLATYNVFNAAVELGLQRVVWASSETVYGFPWEKITPDYFPMDFDHPLRPQNSYAISKLMSEKMAEEFTRNSGIPFIGLRFSHVRYEHEYENWARTWSMEHVFKWNLWGYVDGRDAAQAVRKSLTVDLTGSHNFAIVADETIMNRPTADLLAQYFPDVPVKEGLPLYHGLNSNQRAKDILGWNPQYSWRQYINDEGESVK